MSGWQDPQFFLETISINANSRPNAERLSVSDQLTS